jgi:hypothetical protein
MLDDTCSLRVVCNFRGSVRPKAHQRGRFGANRGRHLMLWTAPLPKIPFYGRFLGVIQNPTVTPMVRRPILATGKPSMVPPIRSLWGVP